MPVMAALALACFFSAKKAHTVDGEPDKSLEADPDFEGSYTLLCTNLTTGEEYEEKLVIHYIEFNDSYVVERSVGEQFSSEDGLEVGGMLGAWQMIMGEPVSIYQKQGDNIAALMMTEDGEIYVKVSEGATPLEPDSQYIRGLYSLAGAKADGSGGYEHGMEFLGDSRKWSVKELFGKEASGEMEHEGFGLSANNVLVLVFDVGGKRILRVYTITGGNLEGRWLNTYWDFKANYMQSDAGLEDLFVQKIYE